MHPVRRKLTKEPVKWRWSSCPLLFRRGRCDGAALPKLCDLASKTSRPVTCALRTTSRSTGSKLPSGTRSVQVNNRQQELKARLWARCVVRTVTVWDLNERGTRGKRREWRPMTLGHPHHTEKTSWQWHPCGCPCSARGTRNRVPLLGTSSAGRPEAESSAEVCPKRCGVGPLFGFGCAAGAPARLGGPAIVCHCLEQAVRCCPKRTGARTFAQIRAVWERPRFSRWPCRRLGVPASVAPTPAGPVCHP